MDDEFYVTLPSNVRSASTDNTTSSYVTHLTSPIQLEGDWKVALVEFSYPFSWFNVYATDHVRISDVYLHSMTLLPGTTGTSLGDIRFYTIPQGHTMMYLPDGRYEDVDALLTDINSMIEKRINKEVVNVEKPLPQLIASKRDKRIIMVQGTRLGDSHSLSIDMNNGLRNMLGLTTVKECYKNITEGGVPSISVVTSDNGIQFPKYCKGDRAYNLRRGVDHLYVYSDVVDFNHVGGTSTQLLRIVDAPGTKHVFGDQIKDSLEGPPHYVNVHSNFIPSISIEIKDGMGEPIKFEFGTAIVKLHFKKV